MAQVSQESSKILGEIKIREEQISKTNLEIEQVAKVVLNLHHQLHIFIDFELLGKTEN